MKGFALHRRAFMSTLKPQPDDIRDLDHGEHLLLWAFRSIAVGHGDCPTLRQTFASALAGSAEETLAALLVVVRTLGFAGRRRLSLHVPGCVCVGADERSILALFAAARESFETSDETRVRTHLAFLLAPHLTEGFLFALQLVVSAFETQGYTLPVRDGGPPARVDRTTAAPRSLN